VPAHFRPSGSGTPADDRPHSQHFTPMSTADTSSGGSSGGSPHVGAGSSHVVHADLYRLHHVLGAGSVLLAPLSFAHAKLGALMVVSEREGGISKLMSQLSTQLAIHVAQALYLKQALEEVRAGEAVITDIMPSSVAAELKKRRKSLVAPSSSSIGHSSPLPNLSCAIPTSTTSNLQSFHNNTAQSYSTPRFMYGGPHVVGQGAQDSMPLLSTRGNSMASYRTAPAGVGGQSGSEVISKLPMALSSPLERSPASSAHRPPDAQPVHSPAASLLVVEPVSYDRAAGPCQRPFHDSGRQPQPSQ